MLKKTFGPADEGPSITIVPAFAAIRTVASGHGLIAPEVTRRLNARFAEISPRTESRPLIDALSGREHQVLLLVARGLTNAEIASRLHLEEATVKKHVGGVLAKLDLRSRAQAVVRAYETGLVRPGELADPGTGEDAKH